MTKPRSIKFKTDGKVTGAVLVGDCRERLAEFSASNGEAQHASSRRPRPVRWHRHHSSSSQSTRLRRNQQRPISLIHQTCAVAHRRRRLHENRQEGQRQDSTYSTMTRLHASIKPSSVSTGNHTLSMYGSSAIMVRVCSNTISLSSRKPSSSNTSAAFSDQ